MAYGDVEELVRAWIDSVTDPGVTVIVEPAEGLPADLAYRLPLVAVSRFGGGDDVLTLDRAELDVDVFASTYQYARALAETLRLSLRLDLAGYTVDGCTAARIRTLSAPRRLDWQAANIHRVNATYEIVTHSRLSAAA